MQPRWLIASTCVISRVNRVFLATSGIFAALIMFVILQDVVRRYVLNDPSSWVLDICSFMLVYAFFLALAPTLEAGGHVSVDLFNQMLPRRFQGGIFILGGLLTLFFGVVLFTTLLSETLEAFADDNIFPASTVAMKMKYIWMIGPIGAAQFILTTLALLSSRLYQRQGR